MTQNNGISNIFIQKVLNNEERYTEDAVAIEEPLEIKIAYFIGDEVLQKSISVTMRTPGNDVDLALGFLFTEGIIHSPEDIVKVKYLEHSNFASKENRLLIGLRKNIDFDLKKLERHFYTSSSCGVCGKASIEAVKNTGLADLIKHEPVISSKTLIKLPKKLIEHQVLFEQTGGIHAAGIFDKNGHCLTLREDVGRHNAVDKAIGDAFKKNKLPLNQCILQVSGRASFELVQKALMAGIPILSAVGAPSSLAVDLAKENGMTLLGFVRGNRFNIYCGKERISLIKN